jgi:alpha-D-ribose 1-methylphosphonate 5-triphosphate synthase subunit PhnG
MEAHAVLTKTVCRRVEDAAMDTMTRRRRTRILVLGPASLRRAWAAEIRSLHAVETLEPPRAGLVMGKVRESARRGLFYLGEVLVTEAKVRVAGAPGLGLLRGWDEEGAVDLAVIDAAERAGLKLPTPWLDRLIEAETALEGERATQRFAIEATRVDFQTMDQPEVTA